MICDFGFGETAHEVAPEDETTIPQAEVARYALAYAEMSADLMVASGRLRDLTPPERKHMIAMGIAYATGNGIGYETHITRDLSVVHGVIPTGDWAVCPACLARWREYQQRFPAPDASKEADR